MFSGLQRIIKFTKLDSVIDTRVLVTESANQNGGMQVRKGICLLLSFLLCLSVLGMTVSAATPDYVATYQLTIGKEIQTHKFFIHDNGNKFRLEIKTREAEMITITRLDKKVTWLLMPESKTYMEQAFDPNAWKDYQCDENFLATKAKKIGEETILGYKCDIYNYKEGSDNITISVSQKEKILLKSIVESGKKKAVMEAKEVKIGKLDGSLFEIPAGYQQFNLFLPILPNM